MESFVNVGACVSVANLQMIVFSVILARYERKLSFPVFWEGEVSFSVTKGNSLFLFSGKEKFRSRLPKKTYCKAINLSIILFTSSVSRLKFFHFFSESICVFTGKEKFPSWVRQETVFSCFLGRRSFLLG